MKNDYNKDELFRKLVIAFHPLTLITFQKLLRNFPRINAENLNQKFWVEHVHGKSILVMQKMENSPGYVVTMVSNYKIDYLRKSQKSSNHPAELKENIPAKEQNIEDKMIQDDKNKECQKTIDDILYLLRRSKVNQAVFLYMLDGLKNDEIAELLELTKESVERRKFKIRKIIKNHLK